MRRVLRALGREGSTCKGPGVDGLSASEAKAQRAEGELQKMRLKREVGLGSPSPATMVRMLVFITRALETH